MLWVIELVMGVLGGVHEVLKHRVICSSQCYLYTEKASSAVYLWGVLRPSLILEPVTKGRDRNACIFYITLELVVLPCVDYGCHQLKNFITCYYLQNKG